MFAADQRSHRAELRTRKSLAGMSFAPYNAPPPGAGWSSLAARRAHNPKVAGSNPAPATTFQRYVPITWVTAYTGRNISYVPDRVNMQPVALAAPSRLQAERCGSPRPWQPGRARSPAFLLPGAAEPSCRASRKAAPSLHDRSGLGWPKLLPMLASRPFLRSEPGQ